MFRQEICQGYDPRWAAKILIEVGMLSPSSEGKFQITFRLPGEGAKRCYRFIHTDPRANYKKQNIAIIGCYTGYRCYRVKKYLSYQRVKLIQNPLHSRCYKVPQVLQKVDCNTCRTL